MLKLNKQNQISPPNSPSRDRRALSQLIQNGTPSNSPKIDYSSNVLVSPVQSPGTHHKHSNTVLSESKENINTLNKPKTTSEPIKDENVKPDLQQASYSLVKTLLSTLHNVPPLVTKEVPTKEVHPPTQIIKPVAPVAHNIPPLFQKNKKAFEIRIQEQEKIKQDIAKRTNNSGWITSEALIESLRALFSMPVFISSMIFKRLSDNTKFIRWTQLQNFWQDVVFCKDTVDASDITVKVFNCLKGKGNVLTVEELKPLVEEVVSTHSGLAFLRDTPEFQLRYSETVLVRIFYDMNCRNGRITLQTFKKSNLVDILRRLETEPDVNNIASCFSYEHFYVIYCKFWELDTDHDLKLSMEDLAKYSNYSLTTKIVERIFQYCYFLRSTTTQPYGPSEDEEPKLTYQDFIWFILSEEDKTTQTSIEYWFRCVDLDDDGIISGYELEFFYEEQAQRMESLGMDPVPFEDLLCQILDMMPDCARGADKCQFTLMDLKRNKMGHCVFDFIFNITKFVAYEKDPFSSSLSNTGNLSEKTESEWNRFATIEYQKAVQEELGCGESS